MLRCLTLTAVAASLLTGTVADMPATAPTAVPQHTESGVARPAVPLEPAPGAAPVESLRTGAGDRPGTPATGTPGPTTAPVDAPRTAAAPTEPPRIPPSTQKAAAAPLDLVGLERRLRDTKAIGVFTKLALKNQVDDLLAQFKAFHEARGGATLAELRERYNLLMLKVLSLLQRGDPILARDLTASREAIWTVLTDPAKFSSITEGG